MALLTTGNFYTATFLPTTNAAWAALAPSIPFGITGELAEAIYKATPTAITFYVIDASSGNIAFVGGQAYGLDDTLVSGAAPVALTKYTLTADDATTTIWGDDGSGVLLMFDQVTGTLRTNSGAAVGGFQAFIAAI